MFASSWILLPNPTPYRPRPPKNGDSILRPLHFAGRMWVFDLDEGAIHLTLKLKIAVPGWVDALSVSASLAWVAVKQLKLITSIRKSHDLLYILHTHIGVT